jgi:hypothetical protein
MSNDKKITLTVVVASTPIKIETNINVPLQSVAEKAIDETHQAVKDLNRWEMTTQAGAVLNYGTKVGDAGLKDGETILMNIRTGVTG